MIKNRSERNRSDIKIQLSELRNKAEKIVNKSRELLPSFTSVQINELVEELKIHQVELEMQNQSLGMALDELEQARNQYADLYDNAPVGYLSSDTFGVIKKANKTLAGMLKSEVENLIGSTLGPWCREPDAYYLHCRALMRNGGIFKSETELDRSDGTTFHVSINSVLFREDSESDVEIRSIITDISERKILEAQLQQAQKMESVGRLAGGVAHDFNNMLFVILGNAELAMDQANEKQPLYDLINEIKNAALRSADVTKQLLAFASRQPINPKAMDLNETIMKMLKMLGRLIGEDIDLVFEPGKELWQVFMDTTQIDQIMANLTVNSKDAINGVGRIVVKTENAAVDRIYRQTHSCPASGEFVKIIFADNGCGMDDDTLQNLFEPFFTTKGVGQGTGLGLATVYGIVKQNCGFITVKSKVGKGTSFNIYLPRYISPAFEEQEQVKPIIVSRGKETILLVEDEEAILELTSKLLKYLGYTVLAALTPWRAMDIASKHAGEIHLLMTDVVMPEMNGRDLAEKLLSDYPDMKKLFMSGYTADVIAHHGILDEGVNFIQKPFSIEKLSHKLREIFDNQRIF